MNTYTREEAMQFLIERLGGKWPTDINDAPLCPGWGWMTSTRDDAWFTRNELNHSMWHLSEVEGKVIIETEYLAALARYPQQPATAQQPAPNGKGDPILGMVLADLTNRALIGNAKYGEPLKAHNGRNALWDAYQEALDMCMYLRQAIEESK